MPKEFLVEFWQILATCPPPYFGGDSGSGGTAEAEAWAVAKGAFLRGIKKGSRSESGGNLRDVGVLLESTSMLRQYASQSGRT